MNILVINGPNMNLLGIREPQVYGTRTYDGLVSEITAYCQTKNVRVTFFQSNHEGAIVDAIQNAYGKYDGIILNPAAYTHTSIAIPDALRAVGVLAVEVHLSDIHKREAYRAVSYTAEACCATICGKGFAGYLEAVDILSEKRG